MRTNGFDSHSSPIVVGWRWPGWTLVEGGSFISLSMIDPFRSSKPVAPGARVPPTVPLKSTSAVSTSVSSIRTARWSAQCPGVSMIRSLIAPDSNR